MISERGKIISKYILLLYKQFYDSLGKKFNKINVFEDNDCYFGCIRSQRKIKKLIKQNRGGVYNEEH